MSLPLWVEPSPNTWTSSATIARTIAVVVTARPSGVVLKYFWPADARWNAPHWIAHRARRPGRAAPTPDSDDSSTWLKGSAGVYHQLPRYLIPVPGLDQLPVSYGLLRSFQTSL